MRLNVRRIADICRKCSGVGGLPVGFSPAVYRRNKPASAPGEGLNETGVFGRVAQRGAQLVDRRAHAVIEVHESIGRPKSFAQLVPGNHVAGMFQQHRQDLKGLLREPDFQSVLMHFTGLQIDLESAETENARRSAEFWQASLRDRQFTTGFFCNQSKCGGGDPRA